MKRRTRRLLIGSLVALLLLVATAGILFCVVVYNPFEGTVDSLASLVPRTTVYFATKKDPGAELRQLPERASFQDLASSPAVTAFLDSPQFREADQKYAIRENLRRIEELDRVLPIDMFADVFGQEIGIAGTPLGTDVTAWDHIFYSRVSWKVRAAIDLCTHPQVRKRVQLDPGMVLADVAGTSYKEFGFLRAGKLHRFYFGRVKDVLVLTNKEELIEDVMALGHGGAGTSLQFDREYRDPSEVVESRGDGDEIEPVGTYVDLGEVRRLFGIDERLASGEMGTSGRLLSEMLGVGSMGRFFGIIEPEVPFRLEGKIRLQADTGTGKRRILTSEGLPVAEIRDKIGPILPSGTFGFLFLRCGVRDLFDLITTTFSPADRKLIDDALKKIPELDDLDHFLGRTSSHFSDEIAAVFSRRDPEKLTGARRYNPKPAGTLILQVLDPAALEEYLAILERDEFALAGIEKSELEGVTVTRGTSKVDGQDMAYAIIGTRFVISSSPEFLDQMILASRDQFPSLAKDETFRKTLEFFGQRASLLCYGNIPLLLDWLSDYASKIASDIHFMTPDLWLDFRARTRQELASTGLRGRELDQAIDARATQKQAEIDEVEIPRTVEDIRGYLDWGRIFLAGGGALSFEGDAVSVRALLHFAVAVP